jgi:hypothetical protein
VTDFSVEDLFGELSENGTSPTAAELFDEIDYGEELATEPTEPTKPFENNTQTIGDGTCRVCGAPTFRPPGVTKAGYKKRAPRYCDDHAPNVSVPQNRSKLKGVESDLQNVKDALAEDVMLLGTLAGPLLPTTGAYIIQQADPFTTAIIQLSKNNKAMLRVLHRAAQVAPIYTVAMTVAGTARAIQVDVNGADPDDTISRRLQVDKAFSLVHPEEANQQQGSYTVAPPPMY